MIKAKVQVMKVVAKRPFSPQMNDLFFDVDDEMVGLVDQGDEFKVHFSHPIDDKFNFVSFGKLTEIYCKKFDKEFVIHAKGGIFKVSVL